MDRAGGVGDFRLEQEGFVLFRFEPSLYCAFKRGNLDNQVSPRQDLVTRRLWDRTQSRVLRIVNPESPVHRPDWFHGGMSEELKFRGHHLHKTGNIQDVRSSFGPLAYKIISPNLLKMMY